MRLNKWLAYHAKISRRQADEIIKNNEIQVNGQLAKLGLDVGLKDSVSWRGKQILADTKSTYVLINKPLGYVCSHNPQGHPTIYELLPPEYQHLKIAGRLDHDSCGLLLLTDDGDTIFQLTHPRFGKQKTYNVTLNKSLLEQDIKALKKPIKLDDGFSQLHVSPTKNQASYIVKMSEGRNRQIRRTFKALGYIVTYLERTQLGPHQIENLKPKQYKQIDI